ncbi:uncharacterized protein [Amphiura filiformis]|uniref:uncharacterized protein n=1 Tax=Amphiura filiformis TaxID=82378 RepID=UPI003B222B4D
MAANTSESQLDLSLTIDIGFNDAEGNNYYPSSPVILSPTGSTQKLIKDGKIRECFVSLQKQVIFGGFKSGENSSDEELPDPDLQGSIQTTKYDHNANVSIQNTSTKYGKKRKGRGRSKKGKHVKKVAGKPGETRNIFSDFSHQESSVYDSEKNQSKDDVTDLVAPNKGGSHLSQSRNHDSAQPNHDSAQSDRDLIQASDVTEIAIPIQHTCGLTSKQRNQVQQELGKRKRNEYEINREILSNFLSSKRRKTDTRPFLSSDSAKNIETGLVVTKDMRHLTSNQKSVNDNLCPKHKKAIESSRTKASGDDDEISIVGSHFLPIPYVNTSQGGCNEEVFQTKSPIDNSTSKVSGDRKGAQKANDSVVEETVPDTSQSSHVIHPNSMYDPESHVIEQTSASTVATSIHATTACQNQEEVTSETETAVAALMGMSNNVINNNTNIENLSMLTVQDDDWQTTHESSEIPDQAVDPQQYSLDALTQAVECAMEQERCSNEDQERATSESGEIVISNTTDEESNEVSVKQIDNRNSSQTCVRSDIAPNEFQKRKSLILVILQISFRAHF